MNDNYLLNLGIWYIRGLYVRFSSSESRFTCDNWFVSCRSCVCSSSAMSSPCSLNMFFELTEMAEKSCIKKNIWLEKKHKHGN